MPSGADLNLSAVAFDAPIGGVADRLSLTQFVDPIYSEHPREGYVFEAPLGPLAVPDFRAFVDPIYQDLGVFAVPILCPW